jgi:hypothetical protein
MFINPLFDFWVLGKRTAWEFPDLNTFANIMTPKKYIQLSIYHCTPIFVFTLSIKARKMY